MVKNINDYLVSYNIESRSINSFWTYMSSWKKDDYEDYIEFLQEIKLDERKLNRDFVKLNKEFIELNIYYDENENRNNYSDYFSISFAVEIENKKFFSYNACYTKTGKSKDDFIKII